MSSAQQFIKSFEKPARLAKAKSGASLTALLKESLFDPGSIKRPHLLSTLLLSLMLILPATGYLAAKFLDQVGENLSRARTISLFIELEPSRNLVAFANKLSEYPQIANAEFIANPVGGTAAAANTGMVEVVPVSDLTSEDFNELTALLGDLAGVELISWNDAMLTRNLQMSQSVRKVALAANLGAMLLLACTMWLLIRRHLRLNRKIVDIKHQLGATAAQIARPLIMKGFLYGLLAAAIAWGFVALFSKFLSQVIDITIFNIDLSVKPLEIFFFVLAVSVFSYYIARLTAKSEISL